MEKQEFIDIFNKRRNTSQLFSAGRDFWNFWNTFRYFFDEEKNIDEIFLKMDSIIKEVIAQDGNLNLDYEKNNLSYILNLTRDNIHELNSWFSESEKERAGAYLPLFGYRNIVIDIQIGLISLLLFSGESVPKEEPLSPPQTPTELIGYRATNNDKDKDLMLINEFNILENAFQKKGWILYPEFNHRVIEKIKQLDFDKAKILVRPKKYDKPSWRSSSKPLWEERMYGPQFKKEDFKRLFEKQYGEYKYVFHTKEDELMAQLYIPLHRLEYVIKPCKNNLIGLLLEETIDTTKTSPFFTSCYPIIGKSRFVRHRLLHAIMDKDTAETNHLDLSYLYYKEDKIEERKAQHIKDRKVDADYKIKILRIDSKDPKGFFAEFELFTDIARLLLDEDKNPEITKFFNAEKEL